jgi:hypothetical protein
MRKNSNFTLDVLKYVIYEKETDNDYIQCILVNAGVSEHLIIKTPSLILTVEVKTNINNFNQERKGFKSSLLSITCGEYKIGITTFLSNIRIISKFFKAIKLLMSIPKFTPIQFYSVEYQDVIIYHHNKE